MHIFSLKTEREIYDLIIIGGGISATFLCLSIYKLNPDFNILIIEKSESFPQKVGESLVDLTAIYVKSLDIDHILEKHTKKTGVRFLFNESNRKDLSGLAEFASPTFPGLITGYHLDRSLFDQQLLNEVISKGARVYRPAEIEKASFGEFLNELDIQTGDEIRYVQSRWVVDATGRSRFIPQKLNWKDKKIKLNTGAIMAHFTNIGADELWDTPENKYWDSRSIGLRKFSTTHLMRKHSWWWIIRLNDTITSIGVVFDKNKIQFDDHESFFIQQIEQDAQLSLMTQHAQRGKIRYVEHIPYVCEKLYAKGIALIGESGAFLDPLISPGIELIGQQTIWLAELFTKEKDTGKFNQSAWDKYSKTFSQAYQSRLKIYELAYDFMHSYDLFSLWLKQGNFIYFGKVVYPAIVFKRQLKAPLRFNVIEHFAIKYFKLRLGKIARKRAIQNRISHTHPHEISYSGVRVPNDLRFLFMPIYLLFKAVWAYLMLEWKELRSTLKN